MKRALVIFLIAAVLLAVAVGVLAPASIVAPYLERATYGRLAVSEVEGTLWRGQGVLAAGTARLPMAWKLDAAHLLAGEAHVHVTPVDGKSPSPRADVMAADRHLALSDVVVVVPAAILQQALTRTLPVRAGWVVDGEIAAATSRLEWTPAAYRGDLRVVWRDARLTLAPALAIDLGEATATLAAQGDRLAGPVVNVGGNLDVRGDVAIGTGGSAAIALLLTPRRADDAELARVLAAIGTPDGAGWRVNWQTRPQ